MLPVSLIGLGVQLLPPSVFGHNYVYLYFQKPLSECPIKYNISIVDNTGKIIHEDVISSLQTVNITNCRPYTNYTVIVSGINRGYFVGETKYSIVSAEAGMSIINIYFKTSASAVQQDFHIDLAFIDKLMTIIVFDGM